MAHFARIKNGIVDFVVVGRDEDENREDELAHDGWIYRRTSYNTHGGVHANGGTPFRKNYAGIGFTYDSERDAFIPPKPFASWLLNEDSCLWDAPVAMPNDGKFYGWDENAQQWKEVIVDGQTPVEQVP